MYKCTINEEVNNHFFSFRTMKVFVFFSILWVSAVAYSLTHAKGTNQQAEVNMLRNHKYLHSNLDFFICFMIGSSGMKMVTIQKFESKM